MTPRQRLRTTLNHRQPDHVCVDFGAGFQTGLSASTISRLRKTLLDEDGFRVKITEPYQMLGEVDRQLRDVIGADVVGVHSPSNMFGFKNEGWKPFELFDGTRVLVPEKFNVTVDEKGGYFMYPEGDEQVPPSAYMPKGGFYFDAVNRQKPLDEAKLDPADNCEEFVELSDADIQYFADTAKQLYESTDDGIYLTFPGLAFGDIALVPATWLKDPRGIRDVEEWYMSIAMRPDYVYRVFEKQFQIALKNIERMASAVGEYVDVVFVSGTDFGTQRGLFMSVDSYRNLFKPFHKAVNDKIHKLTNWKTFIHTCGSVYDLIGDLIEAGFDILNPVQCSAAKMEPSQLKKEFGDELVFWGGGIDT